MRGAWILGVCLGLGVAGTASAAERFAALQARLESGRIGSVEALVAGLPQDLRTHYALAFESRSLQGASPANPRAILFGSDAGLVVTFNGEAGERGYDAVETMEFDAAAERFVFREIRFAPDGDPAGRTISEPNPARCTACHGVPARPVWDAPPAWPGIYGERYHAGLSAEEARGMRQFLALQPAHPRYRHLIGAARLAERESYVPTARQAYDGVTVEPANAQLSALLATLNVRSIRAELAAQPGFAAHRYVLLAMAQGGCGTPASFYPDREQALLERDYAAFQRLASAADRRQSASKALRRASRTEALRGAGAPADFAALRFVAERSFGLATRHWTLALEHDSYDLAAPDGALTLGQALWELVAGQDRALRDLASYRTFGADDRYCAHLRRESRRALGAWYAEHALAAPAEPASAPAGSRPALLDSCIGCHSSGVGPPLPFADPAQLGARLHERRYPRGRLLDELLYRLAPEAGAGRMPRGLNPSPREQQELEGYFLSLAAAQRGD
jgi:hypothetical protein